ncbi:Beta-2-syntrophin [Dufourea novaeangliae]|uniref:Beta-2-syntrophin n=1 Tax=Dufourea novaeangliae TaxID=178035 RepID=A0A154P2Q3_DUFNO|nr:Beta-2-syntrophin [Dufourea novaeangliae]
MQIPMQIRRGSVNPQKYQPFRVINIRAVAARQQYSTVFESYFKVPRPTEHSKDSECRSPSRFLRPNTPSSLRNNVSPSQESGIALSARLPSFRGPGERGDGIDRSRLRAVNSSPTVVTGPPAVGRSFQSLLEFLFAYLGIKRISSFVGVAMRGIGSSTMEQHRSRIPRTVAVTPGIRTNRHLINAGEGRILELHSPDGVHECWLRAADNAEASVWFNALHSALAALTLKALRLASALPDPPQLQHIGWLARRHCLQNGRASSESSEDGAGSSASTSRGAGSGFGLGGGCTGGWRSVFGAVSGRELRLYECAPWSPEAWASPSITCPLIATRLVSSPARQNEAGSSSSGSTQHAATFAVRVGTIDGVVTHHLRSETRRDLAAWARAIVQGCHAAAHSLREYTVRCTWQGKACQLVVNHEDGFALYAAGTRGVGGNGVSPGSPPTPLWRRSFDKLKMSADDGARLLWLDFGGDDGEINSRVPALQIPGAGPRELSEADRVRPAQLPLGEDPSAGAERIGVRGGPDRGPRPTAPHHQVRHQRVPPLNPDRNVVEREREKREKRANSSSSGQDERGTRRASRRFQPAPPP